MIWKPVENGKHDFNVYFSVLSKSIWFTWHYAMKISIGWFIDDRIQKYKIKKKWALNS